MTHDEYRMSVAIEPKECPEPEPTDSSGYMRGVVEGAEAGTKAQEDYL